MKTLNPFTNATEKANMANDQKFNKAVASVAPLSSLDPKCGKQSGKDQNCEPTQA